jgi:hypothetical protein
MAESKSGGSNLLTVLLALIAIVLVGVIVWQVLALVNRQSAGYGDAAARACRGASRQLALAAELPPGSHYAVLTRSSGAVHTLNTALPAERRAADAADLNAVFCLEDEDTTYANEYYYIGDRRNIQYTCTRVQVITHAYLVNVSTGQTMLYDRFTGGLPPECPPTAPGSMRLAGTPPDPARIANWIVRSAR